MFYIGVAVGGRAVVVTRVILAGLVGWYLEHGDGVGAFGVRGYCGGAVVYYNVWVVSWVSAVGWDCNLVMGGFVYLITR